jgi:starvation-inducible DNA-binding protein
MKNYIGISPEQAELLSTKLNMLLSNYQVFYMNTRGFHWNITGEKFFELHLKFEEIYNNTILKIDEVAERILTLGGVPIHSFSEYLVHSEIPEIKNMSNGKEAVRNLLEGFEVIIRIQREILQLAADANDEATNALMSDYIREQEKLVWMFVAYLK